MSLKQLREPFDTKSFVRLAAIRRCDELRVWLGIVDANV
jgi:hypothetical protein